jgi:predicted unusual protein kinase regulating ubiquinone biosynthesis (AarF/ABC1/UbiB family)
VIRDYSIRGIKKGFAERAAATGKIAFLGARLSARKIAGFSGETDGDIGASLAAELDEMKGMAMKVGQILSYFDGVLPKETHEALRALQAGVTPVAYTEMRAILEQDLGASIESLFEEFDEEPVAAASIGQVYRAKYLGENVAVKIQYPGIAATIDGDFSRIGKIAKLASAVTAVDGMAIAKDLQRTMAEECDYLREFRMQEAFSRAFDSWEDVQIPAVHRSRTSMRVLTSAWCDGHSLYDLIQNSGTARKEQVGILLARVAFHSFFGLHCLNADPHPGNYIFPDNGPVVFIDFGCVRHFDASFVETERALARIVIEDKRAGFRDTVMATGMIDNPNRFDFEIHWSMLRHQYEPYWKPGFYFDRSYLERGMQFSQPSNPNLRKMSIPPPWIWQQRLIWGLHAILAKLEIRSSLRPILEDALSAKCTPLTDR